VPSHGLTRAPVLDMDQASIKGGGCQGTFAKRRCRSWLQDTVKRKLGLTRRFRVESAIFLSIYPARACLFSCKPGSKFQSTDFFYPWVNPERLFFYQSSGQPRANPGEREGGGEGAKKIKKNRRVFFSRYLAANDDEERRSPLEALR